MLACRHIEIGKRFGERSPPRGSNGALRARTRDISFRKRILAMRRRNYRYPQIDTTFGGHRKFTHNRLFQTLDAHG